MDIKDYKRLENLLNGFVVEYEGLIYLLNDNPEQAKLANEYYESLEDYRMWISLDEKEEMPIGLLDESFEISKSINDGIAIYVDGINSIIIAFQKYGGDLCNLLLQDIQNRADQGLQPHFFLVRVITTLKKLWKICQTQKKDCCRDCDLYLGPKDRTSCPKYCYKCEINSINSDIVGHVNYLNDIIEQFNFSYPGFFEQIAIESSVKSLDPNTESVNCNTAKDIADKDCYKMAVAKGWITEPFIWNLSKVDLARWLTDPQNNIVSPFVPEHGWSSIDGIFKLKGREETITGNSLRGALSNTSEKGFYKLHDL